MSSYSTYAPTSGEMPDTAPHVTITLSPLRRVLTLDDDCGVRCVGVIGVVGLRGRVTVTTRRAVGPCQKTVSSCGQPVLNRAQLSLLAHASKVTS